MLLISTDGGDHWRVSNTQVDGHGASLVVDPLDANRLYVGTWYAGVWRSQDGGNSFQSINNGLPSASQMFLSVSVDPSNPERIYLGVGGSVYFSSNQGGHWTKVAGDLSTENGVDVITVDPQNPQNVYACAGWDGAFQLLGWDPNNP